VGEPATLISNPPDGQLINVQEGDISPEAQNQDQAAAVIVIYKRERQW
jgi:hypothetical protein